MADSSLSVRVEGLADFQKELRRIDLAKDLRLANLGAAELVANRARSRATSQGSVAAKTAPSIKAAAEQRRAKVALGGNQFPFALGAEFGGQGRPTTQQFKPHLGRRGYFLYETVRDTRDEFIAVYAHVLDDLMRRAFPSN